MELFAAFAIGFFGSFHCIGMCGPIVLALPVNAPSNWSFILGRVLYNVGRVLSYSFMGALLGLLGSKFLLWGFQQTISIALGIIIIISVLLPAKYKATIASHKLVQKINLPIKKSIGVLFSKGTASSLFLIGILNGFLPCGFVYIGLAGAIAAGDAISGAAFMMLFGTGTIPIMFAASIFGKFINLNVRKKIRKAVPALAFILAVIFILRGMSLGIPYISPKLSSAFQTQEKMCH
jgi:hypothetical protein